MFVFHTFFLCVTDPNGGIIKIKKSQAKCVR